MSIDDGEGSVVHRRLPCSMRAARVMEEASRDEALMARLQAGDAAAAAELYERHHAAVYRFARHMGASRAVAEDVTQDTFMTIIRRPSRFDTARGLFKAFLFGV